MKKVMIVEDEEEVCQALARVIKRKGFETITCGDGKTAVEMYKAHRPEITFLDLHIPELKGWEVFDEIRKIDSGAKVYFVTGSRDDVEALKAKNCPVNGYLIKPIDLNEIVKILAENK